MDNGSLDNFTCTKPVNREETGLDISPSELEYKYFVWLCNMVGMDGSLYSDETVEHVQSETSHLTFFTLGHILYSTPFRVLVERDDNRAADGMQLRRMFSCVGPGYRDCSIIDREFCSVLEMLIGLASRMDRSIVSHPDFPWENKMTMELFWMILNNIGIYAEDVTDEKLAEVKPESGQTASQVVDKIIWIKNVINIANNRTYKDDGIGSFFPVKAPPNNWKNLELWMQMQAWVVENEL